MERGAGLADNRHIVKGRSKMARTEIVAGIYEHSEKLRKETQEKRRRATKAIRRLHDSWGY